MSGGIKIHIPEEVRFAPVGRCVYCGRLAQDVARLSDEHIIPFAFGGHYVLPSASCEDCSDITGALCGQLCDLMLGSVRWHHGLPSRKTKERQKTIRVGVADHGELVYQRFHYEVAPSIVAFPTFELPGILAGKPLVGENVPLIGLQMSDTVPDNIARQKALKQSGIDRALAIAQVPVGPFMRMLAQIGHGFQVSQQGYSDGLLLADVVTGKNPNISHFVGGTPSQLNFVEEPQFRHGLHQVVPLAVSVDGVGYVAVQIRLFSFLNPPSPVYTVVISQRDVPKGDAYLSFTRNKITNNVNVESLVMA